MSNCPDCGKDHKPLLTKMPESILPVITEYEKQVDAFVDRLMSDKRIAEGANGSNPFDVATSIANSMIARAASKMALRLFEKVEEKLPQVDSRQQLATAFAAEFGDLEFRTGLIAAHYANHGELPTAKGQMEAHKEAETVH